jgi:hypothetical protein
MIVDRKKYHRIYYQLNKNKIKIYRDSRKVLRAHYDKERREKLSKEIALMKKIYHEKNKEKDNLRTKKWRLENKEYLKQYFKKRWEKDGKALTRERLKRRKSNVHLRIKHNISSLIQQRLKRRLLEKGGKSIFSFLPYTLEELMVSLSKQFKKKMTWKNYGKWHIDHIIPDCKFQYQSVNDKEFQQCWSLENLQPLWAEDNLIKNKF